MTTSGDVKLGEILVADAGLSKGDLGRGLALARGTGQRLGSALVALEVVSADAVASALAKQHGVAAARDKHLQQIAPETLALVPTEVVRRLCAVPVGLQRGDRAELVVAMRDPRDAAAIAELERVSGHRIRPAVACEARLRERVDELKDASDAPPLELIDLAPPPIASARAAERIDLTPPPALVAHDIPKLEVPALELPPPVAFASPADDLELAEPLRPRTPSAPPASRTPSVTGLPARPSTLPLKATPLPPGPALLDTPKPPIIVPAFVRRLIGLAISLTVGWLVYHYAFADRGGGDRTIDGPMVSGTVHAERAGLTLTLPDPAWHDVGDQLGDTRMPQLGDSIKVEVFARGDEVPPDAMLMVIRVSQPGAFADFDAEKMQAGLDSTKQQGSKLGNGMFTLNDLDCRVGAVRSAPLGVCDGTGELMGSTYDAHFLIWPASDDDVVFVFWLGHGGADDAMAVVKSIQLD